MGANAVLSTLPQPLQTAGIGFFLRYPGVPAQLLDAVRDGGAAQRFSALGMENGAGSRPLPPGVGKMSVLLSESEKTPNPYIWLAEL